MARLSEQQWEKVKADYATGRFSIRVLSERHGVSIAAISKRSNAEGWEKLEPETVSAFVGANVAMRKEVDRVAQVNKVNSVYLSRSLEDLAEFEIQSNERMALVENKAMRLLDEAEKATDVKAIMDTLVKHREARLGKSPDTAIQINNTTDQDHASTAMELLAIKRKLQEQ